MKSILYSFCYRNKYKLLVCGSLLIVALYFLSRLNVFPSNQPRDSELVASFREHRQAFEALCAMALEDSGKASYISLKTLSEDDLDSRRRAKYKDLLKEVELVTDISTNDHERVMFSYHGGGLAAFGPTWSKGIAYYPGGDLGPDHRVVDDLDDLEDRTGIYVMPLEKNWYLIYQNFGDE